MSSCDKKYNAGFFKKDLLGETNNTQSKTDNKIQQAASEFEILIDDETSSKDEISTEEEISAGVGTSSEDDGDDETSSVFETSSEDEVEEEFENEDKLISRLYREVVDDLMASNNLKESTVNAAILSMKQQILQGHKKGFRRFPGIDFRKPVNCCGYLRRYAICHTGLVKKVMWKFFRSKMPLSEHVKNEITNVSHLKVAALGGGPGNDLVGFCSALQEIPNSIEKLELIVADVCKGWEPVFPKILLKAKKTDYGRFSVCLNKKILTGFMEADLINDEESLSVLGQSDVLLMVKVISFLSPEDSDILINNVVDSMKPDAILIFIDQPYDGQFFREIKSLDCIYHDFTKYELSFNPSRSHSPSIRSCQAHVAILKKKIICTDEATSESEEE